MKNEMFIIIYKNFKDDLEKIFKNDSACLLFYRCLTKQTQQIIMRVINIEEELNMTQIEFINKINFSDFLDSNKDEIIQCFRYLCSIKIFPKKDQVKLDPDFKNNMKKIIKEGIKTKTEFILKSKHKTWTQCYNKGIAALEKYLTFIKSLDSYNESSENEKINFLVKSGFLSRETDNNSRLTPLSLSLLLDDRQCQIRTLMVRFIATLTKTELNTNRVDFLYFLFTLCTLEIGVVFL